MYTLTLSHIHFRNANFGVGDSVMAQVRCGVVEWKREHNPNPRNLVPGQPLLALPRVSHLHRWVALRRLVRWWPQKRDEASTCLVTNCPGGN